LPRCARNDGVKSFFKRGYFLICFFDDKI